MTMAQAAGYDLARALVAGAVALLTLTLLGYPAPGALGFLALYVVLTLVAGLLIPLAVLVVVALVRRAAR